MRRRLLVAVGSGLIGGVLVAADAGRQPGYIAAYHAAAALLALVIVVLTALVLCIPTRSRPAGVVLAFGGIAFYGAFVLSMTTLERKGAWDRAPLRHRTANRDRPNCALQTRNRPEACESVRGERVVRA